MTKLLLFACFVILTQVCCANEVHQIEDDTPVQISPDPKPQNAKLQDAAQEHIRNLDRFAPKDSSLYPLIADIRYLLEGESLEEKGSHQEAAKKYFSALEIADGRFAEHALNRWVKAYAQSLKNKVQPSFLARLLNDISQNGKTSPYLKNNGYVDADSFIPLIMQQVPEALLPDEIAAVEFPKAPNQTGVPKDDPTLKTIITEYCQGKGEPGYQWQAWKNSLPNLAQQYWEQMIKACQGDKKSAYDHLKQISQQLLSNSNTIGMGLAAIKDITMYVRYNGSREQTADSYKDLVTAWAKTGITPESMGMSQSEFQLERVNDHLWAARYRALIGDYESGKIYANNSLDLIKKAHTIKSIQTSQVKRELAVYKAEAYIILANRIAVEQKDMDAAISFMLIAQRISMLPANMYDRVLWYTGFFYYLNGDTQKSIKHLTTLLNRTREDKLQSKAFFWLARAHIKIGQKEQATSYIKRMMEKYPHHYYSVVALGESGIATDNLWKSKIGSVKQLRSGIQEKRNFDLSRVKNEQLTYKKLKRAEIMIISNLGFWAQEGVKDLHETFKKHISLSQNNEAYLYLSRLHFAAGNYLEAIVLTTILQNRINDFWEKWPEQMIVYFPRPFDDIYSRNALETSLDKKILLSISRQESAFNPSAASHAGAFGLMQLIVPTAKKVASSLGIYSGNIKDDLTEPELNIKLGSHYLKDLSIRYPGFKPAIFGAYNAGEYAVDVWLERRPHKDPLAWVELVPFGETRSYIKNVWRNTRIYEHLEDRRFSSNYSELKLVFVENLQKNIKSDISQH